MNPYLLSTLELGPIVIRRLMAQIPRSRLDESLDRDRFTPREIVAHLADWEPIMRGRILTAARKPGSHIVALDESAMAISNGYAAADPCAQCDLFERERRATAAYVRSLDPVDWQHVALHPERGPLTAEDLTNLLLGHDMYHIEQLTVYLTMSPST